MLSSVPEIKSETYVHTYLYNAYPGNIIIIEVIIYLSYTKSINFVKCQTKKGQEFGVLILSRFVYMFNILIS